MEKFRFSNGQDLASLDSTGSVSDNYWDLEQNAATDMNLFGWLHVLILTSTNTGGDEGLDIQVRSADATNLSTTPIVHGALQLTQSQIAAGGHYVIGIHAHACERYAGVWYKAVSTALDNATTVDAWWEDGPGDRLQLQKKNTSSGAS